MCLNGSDDDDVCTKSSCHFRFGFHSLDLRGLDISKSLLGKTFRLVVLVASTDKSFGGLGYDQLRTRNKKGYDENCLTSPGSSLLPFPPGFGLYLHLGLLLQLGVALPRHLLAEVRFVHAVTAGSSVNFLQAV